VRKHEGEAWEGTLMYSDPSAYLLTWTCHGTWLHGDERGSVDEQHNRYGRPMLAANPMLKEHRRAELSNPPSTLS
jgi:hypothetical protein